MSGEEFKQRFLPMSRKLYGVALRFCGNPQDAEDIVQDAYVRLWERRDRLLLAENAEAYCVAMTKDICLDRIRSGKTRATVCMPENLRVADSGSVSEEAETKDYAGIMRRCIDRLPQRQRQLVTMRDVNGLSYSEISQATGINEVNIRVTLSRARNTLREQFKHIRDYGNKRH